MLAAATPTPDVRNDDIDMQPDKLPADALTVPSNGRWKVSPEEYLLSENHKCACQCRPKTD